jgi:bacterioferritin-associated ferredoxin
MTSTPYRLIDGLPPFNSGFLNVLGQCAEDFDRIDPMSDSNQEPKQVAKVVPSVVPTVVQRDPGQTICFCHNVTYEELQKAIAEGATTIEAIREQTCANTGCGGCEYEVTEILAEELHKVELAKVAAK